MENVDSAKNHDDPRKEKLPSPIKSSALCKQSQTDQAYCDTEERLDVSLIKEISAKQSMIKGESKVEAAPVFVKSIPRLELPRFSGDQLEWPQFISLCKCLVHDQPLTDTLKISL